MNFTAKKRELSAYECSCLLSTGSIDHAIACCVGNSNISVVYCKESACAKLFAIQVKCERTTCGIGNNLEGNVADHLDVGNGAILCRSRIKCFYQRAAACKVFGIVAPLCLDNGLGVGGRIGLGIGGRIRIGSGSGGFTCNIIYIIICHCCNSFATYGVADVAAFGENDVLTV